MPGAQVARAAAVELMFFEGFTLETREANGQRIRLRRAGSGPPLLLLHGNPQTHAMWHRVAPSPLSAPITRLMPNAQWPPIWWR
jgi:haloacetate dehalogenase